MEVVGLPGRHFVDFLVYGGVRLFDIVDRILEEDRNGSSPKPFSTLPADGAAAAGPFILSIGTIGCIIQSLPDFQRPGGHVLDRVERVDIGGVGACDGHHIERFLHHVDIRALHIAAFVRVRIDGSYTDGKGVWSSTMPST